MQQQPAVALPGLAPPCAHGAPPAQATLRAEPEDFLVEEDLGFTPSGSGQHLLLKVRKRNANTQWVARQLAATAGCRASDVGYAGLKDRRAVAVQWFSVPRPRAPVSWAEVSTTEFAVLETYAHGRKLPRGALAGNRFSVRLRATDGDGGRLAAALGPRLEAIDRRGVPNYFGPQRFGRDGGNVAPLAAAADGCGDLSREARGFALSAGRALVFNAVLAARVSTESWERLLPGDLAALDGRGSIFAVPAPDAALITRCARLEIHPTGPMWGAGDPGSGGEVLALEKRIAGELAVYCAQCVRAGMRQERRSLRLAVRELRCEPEADAVMLRFRLARGSFATAVLRELIAG
ncbi:MAG TPA: tRNA pseudouridine(13) synthase TruD [Steroidobacteraceae bacterium]|nr:tRNA pseudouridine(13) synthase TruD [Steroidobacteraceae bacterium]